MLRVRRVCVHGGMMLRQVKIKPKSRVHHGPDRDGLAKRRVCEVHKRGEACMGGEREGKGRTIKAKFRFS